MRSAENDVVYVSQIKKNKKTRGIRDEDMGGRGIISP